MKQQTMTPTMSGSKMIRHNPWVWTFTSIAENRAFIRRSEILDEELFQRAVSQTDRLLLSAILLVETSQRTALWRVAERIIDAIEFGLRLQRRRTLGVFQMSGAPISFRKQIVQAAGLLKSLKGADNSISITALARAWNGSSVPQPGSSLGYANALQLAMKVIRVADSKTQAS